MKDELNLTEIGFKIAFGVVDFKTWEVKDDPNFVRWTVKMREGYNFNTIKNIFLSFHKCTDADYEEFYPVSTSEKALYEKFRSLRALYCIDAGQDMLIRGSSYMDHNALDIVLNPCRPNITGETCQNNTLDKTK